MKRWAARVATAVGVGLAALALAFAVAYLSLRPRAEVPATVADDPTLPHVTLDGVTLHAETFGDAANPVVIVLHGGPGSDYRYLLPVKALADEFYVVFYDQRGTGLSPRVPAEELTLASTVEDLHRIVEHYAPERNVHLLGHSWGAIVAAYYIAEHPDRVQGAVLAEPGVLTDEDAATFTEAMTPAITPAVLWGFFKAWVRSLHVDGPDDQAAADYLVHEVMSLPGDNPMNVYWCDGVPPPGATVMWRIGATANQAILGSATGEDGVMRMPPLDGLTDYPHEALFIASECNSLIGVDLQREHLDLFPRARLEVIEDAGHTMFGERPDASLAVVREYLATFEPAGAR